MIKPTYIIALTGAAGNIGSSLIYQLLKPGIFQTEPYKVILRLIDLEDKHDLLAGRIMEIEDSFFETYEKAEIYEDCEDAFRDADCVILAGARPRTVGMERQDLLRINAKIIQFQAKLINGVAKNDTKILVVGNPSNTNAFLFAEAAPDIPKSNITSLSMLDFNRAVVLLSKQAKINPRSIKNVRVYGNHSKTMYIDASQAYAELEVDGKTIQKKMNELVSSQFLDNVLQKTVQDRGLQIIEAIGYSSSFSAAYAIIKHLKCWYRGSEDVVAVGAFVNDFLNCGTELCVTLPVRARNQKFVVEENPLEGLSDAYLTKVKASINELIFEKNMALTMVKE